MWWWWWQEKAIMVVVAPRHRRCTCSSIRRFQVEMVGMSAATLHGVFMLSVVVHRDFMVMTRDKIQCGGGVGYYTTVFQDFIGRFVAIILGRRTTTTLAPEKQPTTVGRIASVLGRGQTRACVCTFQTQASVGVPPTTAGRITSVLRRSQTRTSVCSFQTLTAVRIKAVQFFAGTTLDRYMRQRYLDTER